MQTFIDFLVNNYLWFLIISLILVFALIGYLVDTSDSSPKIKKRESFENLEDAPIMQTMEEPIQNISNDVNRNRVPTSNQDEIEVLDDLE